MSCVATSPADIGNDVPFTGAVSRARESKGRARAPTLIAAPAPPSRGSVAPPLIETVLFTVGRTYSSRPPSMRERAPTIELEDDDIIEVSSAVEAPPQMVASWLARERGDARPSLWQSASACARALAAALGARAAIVYAHDPERGELRVIGAEGLRTQDLLGAVVASARDAIASATFSRGRPTTHHSTAALPARHRSLGASESVVAFPVIVRGRHLALIEIVDADDARAAHTLAACAAAAAALVDAL